jgi:hypothetical protein
MKERIENLTYHGNTTKLAELEICRVWVESGLDVDGNRKATTLHKVSSVYESDGEEVVELVREFNLSFAYNGGNLFDEAMAAINSLITKG